MSEFKVVSTSSDDRWPGHVVVTVKTDQEVDDVIRLVDAAPDLLFSLKSIVDNAEQRSFEDWLLRTAPSGDCESVHAQWLECGDYEDFANDWAKQLASIAMAAA